ncbi:MAG: oxygenase MpaB family protein, partial [Maricaulaceae bacterium]|jgi:uncharacterized protein (DUF2236 family)
VILELAEPRVRAGVWEHTRFREAPRERIQRTGLAAMVTVYGARSVAQALITRVNRMHARVRGTTPEGEPYAADDPELLTWVHATAAFGFVEAYSAYVAPLSRAERDRFYAEGREAAQLYGAVNAPTSQVEMDVLFDVTLPRLAPSPVVFEFLNVVRAAPILPPLARGLQAPMIKAAVSITPAVVRRTLGLGSQWTANALDRALVRFAARAADQIVLDASPAALACRRLGLPADWLWRRRP